MRSAPEPLRAQARVRKEGETLVVELGGRWRITEPRPAWSELVDTTRPKIVRLELTGMERWDSSLPLFIMEVRQWCAATEARVDETALPERVLTLLGQITAAPVQTAGKDRAPDLVTAMGLATKSFVVQVRSMSHFIGECTLGLFALIKRPDKFRWRDCLSEMQQCGVMALPIVGLIGLLVGLTLAYTAAVLLRQFGADIYVADFVGLVMVREMGPMMTAIVLAGRTGAAFAATIANMKANEEIDALETLGLKPVEFLALPRLVAVALMMPLLALYSNILGILGGMIVAMGILKIPPAAYWVELQTAVDLSDVGSGLVKAATFGLIVGLAGCLRGLEADRSSAGVGNAATKAVVMSILLTIVADSIYAVIFNILGW